MTDALQARLRSGAVTPADLDAAADRIDALEAKLRLNPVVQEIRGKGEGPYYAVYMDAWDKDILSFLRLEQQRIMGPVGSDYTQEPVTVYGAAQARIEALQAELDEARAALEAWRAFDYAPECGCQTALSPHAAYAKALMLTSGVLGNPKL